MSVLGVALAGKEVPGQNADLGLVSSLWILTKPNFTFENPQIF